MKPRSSRALMRRMNARLRAEGRAHPSSRRRRAATPAYFQPFIDGNAEVSYCLRVSISSQSPGLMVP